MSVKVNGVKKLDVNYFEQITIVQKDMEDYFVNVLGKPVKSKCSNFSSEIKEMSDCDKVIAIIKRYLDNFKINGFSDLIELPHREGKWNVIFGCNGSKILRLQLFNPKFRNIFQFLKKKYLSDRYDFFWNEDIKLVRFRLSTNQSSYTQVEHCVDSGSSCEDDGLSVESVMFCDSDYNVLKWEYNFIREFLFHKFWQIGEEVSVGGIFETYPYSHNRRLIRYVIECGDFKVSFPNSERFGFILGIVNDYKEELFQIEKKIKERQLKMEDF